MSASLVGSEMCIRDSERAVLRNRLMRTLLRALRQERRSASVGMQSGGWGAVGGRPGRVRPPLRPRRVLS
eukprot:4405846-Alexandrium_andersonii.AAC.1